MELVEVLAGTGELNEERPSRGSVNKAAAVSFQSFI